MVFSSLNFLFVFLPIVLGLYFIVPRFLKNLILFIGSILFYAWGEPIYVVLMLFCACFCYVIGLDIARLEGKERKIMLAVAIVVNLFLLGFFKYYGFCVDTINQIFNTTINVRALALPIGISFYTFQALSYLIDVYRGKTEVQRNFLHFALYLSLFPQLIAGPIVKYADVADQLADRPGMQVSLIEFLISRDKGQRRSIFTGNMAEGVTRFLMGLGKKVMLANNLGMIYTAIQATESRSVLAAWLGIIAYTLQIYFDFSGYSDMAIGLGKMFGFTFNENFNYPYISESITGFWRRWHMSLSSWFRDYVYIPLGGNRVSLLMHVRNILIVWMLTGLWHGAAWNFVLWGLYYGLLLLGEKYLWGRYLDMLPTIAKRIITFVLVVIGWVFFSNDGLKASVGYLGNMFGQHAGGFLDSVFWYALKSNWLLLILGILIATPIPKRLFNNLTKGRPVVRIGLLIGLFLLCISYLVASTYNPFLYFRF